MAERGGATRGQSAVSGGAEADRIAQDTPGVAWVKVVRRREAGRTRTFHVIDHDLDELTDYVQAGLDGPLDSRRAPPHHLLADAVDQTFGSRADLEFVTQHHEHRESLEPVPSAGDR